MIATLKRQLAPYLEGRLSNPSAELLDKTSSAPLHNIAAERCLGMFDHLARRAPNATVGFVDCKVRAALNKTLQFVMDRDEQERGCMLQYAIKRAAVTRKEKSALLKQNLDTAQGRQIDKAQDKDDRTRARQERELRKLVDEGDVDAVLSKMPEGMQDLAQSVLLHELPSAHTLQHVWDVDGEETTYELHIVKYIKHKKVWFVDVMYAGSGEFQLTVPQMLTDIMLGDLFIKQ